LYRYTAVLHLIGSPDALRTKMQEAIAVFEADGYVAPAAAAPAAAAPAAAAPTAAAPAIASKPKQGVNTAPARGSIEQLRATVDNINASKPTSEARAADAAARAAAFDAAIEEPLKALNAVADCVAESLKAAKKEHAKSLKAYERSAAKVAASAAAKSTENEATEEAADGIITTAADSSLLPAAAAAEAAKLRHPGALSDSDEDPFWEAPPASTYGRVSVGTQTADSARDAQPPEPPVQIAATAADTADILQASTEEGWNFGDFAAEPNTPTAASNDSFDMLDSDGI
jgi:transcription termination factor Rho